jgi:hypothetical protein
VPYRNLLTVVLTLLLVPPRAGAAPVQGQWPTAEQLQNSPQKLSWLPGTDSVTFTMYGAPADLPSLKALAECMRSESLGNGFDPGPGPFPANRPAFDYLRRLRWPLVSYAQTADHQVKDGNAALTDEQHAMLQELESRGLFVATQLGEWGYYFHNLSHDESWWRAVYGDQFRHRQASLKPPDFAGYDRLPVSRQECYAVLEDYFRTRQQAMRGWNLSVTGHSHYEAYAGQWGARAIGLEVGENIAFTQSKIAFARGAARRTGKPWSVQVSPWFAGACTTAGPLSRDTQGNARGLDAGHSLSFYSRMWRHAWFAGAAMVTPENSHAIFFSPGERPCKLTDHARRASEVFRFIRQRDRGIPYTPIAIVLDQYAGYNGYRAKPWGILEPTLGDRQIETLLEDQLFPQSDHIHERPFPDNPEASYLRPTPYGELFDVQLSDAPADVLASYEVLILAGDHQFSSQFGAALGQAVAGGVRLLCGADHAAAFGGERWEELRGSGAVEVLAAARHGPHGNPTVISSERLAQLRDEHMPVRISGDAIGFQVNRLPHGWAIELMHNDGVVKFPDRPAHIDTTAVARVRLQPRSASQRLRDWETGAPLAPPGAAAQVEVLPGGLRYVEVAEDGPM